MCVKKKKKKSSARSTVSHPPPRPPNEAGNCGLRLTRAASCQLTTHFERDNVRAREPLALGGKDRHFCIGVTNLAPLVAALEKDKIPFTVRGPQFYFISSLRPQ